MASSSVWENVFLATTCCGKMFSLPQHVVARKTFSHTPDEAMSDGLAKACGLGKMYSVEESISHFIENQTE